MPIGDTPIDRSIRIDAVTVTRDGRDVLREVTLELNERRIAIIGANGSGKSTLVRLLNGLVLPTSGTVRVGGIDTRRNAKKVRRQVGFVFQNPENQIVMPRVEDDIAFGVKNLGVRGVEVTERVDAILARMGLEDLRERESHTLSGGEKQLVALAAVLVMEPSTIVFDEPTTMLDLRNRRRLQRHIDRLEQQAILVTHDLDMIEAYERALVIDEGRVAFDGPAARAREIYEGICA